MTTTTGRPRAGRLVVDQLAYAEREMWRTRIVLIFTFVLPVTWLVIIGAVAGNEVLSDGVRVMQFVTPAAAAMGVLYASYPPVAISLSLAREQGILKRLRGTPLPPWTYLTGRIGGAVGLAVIAVSAMLVVGVVAYDIQIIWRTAAATLVTLVVGIATFAALGLAVAAVSPSAAIAQAVSIGTAIALTFVSDMFTVGAELPTWMSRVGSFFPLKHLVNALQDQFNPFLTGSGWDWSALAVMGVWLVAGVLVAAWRFGWEPRVRGGAATTATTRSTGGDARRAVAEAGGRPSAPTVLLAQTRWANRAAWRDPGWVFFAIAMPLGLYAFMVALWGDSGFRPEGMAFALFFAAGMTTYGSAITAFINMPEAVALSRDRGVLKRLRGTPLSPAQYLAGRTASVLWIALVTAALIFATGMVFFDVTVGAAGIPLALAFLLLGTLTLAACGFALASVVPSSKAMTAVGLAVLLPLSFFSDVFLIGDAPEWMSAVGSAFPLKPMVHGIADALDPAGTTLQWSNVAVLVAWLAVATAVAVRRFRWEVRSDS